MMGNSKYTILIYKTVNNIKKINIYDEYYLCFTASLL